MARITALRSSKGRSHKIIISLDDGSVLNLGAETALKEGLCDGQELSAIDIAALKQADRRQGCYESAVRYLSYRPRSEFEMRQHLTRRRFDDNDIQSTLNRLKKGGLLDDIAFAVFWKDNRQSFSPRSAYMTATELRQKGISKEIIEQVVSGINDDESAYRAAQSKVRSLKAADYQAFRHRLGGYLRRRGFNYEAIVTTVDRLWQEKEESGETDSII